ncbi:MAG: hypothetical protein ETSY2_23895 [Candidatus Entotheonella gemina]|uniref:DUF1800 domain-containing protein n=1 Tax=Candidatus Entotheonella gemina TaxID=1429439 RepID=W4M534_9BACT|nr:MAG: hypothetical protein ETSY2_23895 [Candidatus Entotheonella gemina]
MSQQDMALMAHLLRRAGFGATRQELEDYLAKGYEATVEELLHPGDAQSMSDDVIRRYHTDMAEMRELYSVASYWMYRMITTRCPLEEKLALFWHGLFATGYSKLNQARSLLNQIEMFRRQALGPLPDFLLELSKDPAMIIWLDNNDNHKEAINENYGRELLELFSMGIGNYTEDDVKECARAFTGWTLGNAEYMATRASKDSIWPYSRIAWHFEYRDYDHDDTEKTFLGETGNFNGEDIIKIITEQEATARFISTRLFQFFAADEVDADGEPVIEAMMQSYFDSGYETRAVLRTLFNSDYFKSDKARYARVKGPIELVVGAVRMAGSYRNPTFGADQLARQSFYMGQGLLQPPSVEGWHEGPEWIDSGALVERVNFVSKEMGNVMNPGVRSIIDRLTSEGGSLTSEALVDQCLDLIGPLEVSDATREILVEFANKQGEVNLEGRQPGDDAEQKVGDMLRLMTATREFQLA